MSFACGGVKSSYMILFFSHLLRECGTMGGNTENTKEKRESLFFCLLIRQALVDLILMSRAIQHGQGLEQKWGAS